MLMTSPVKLHVIPVQVQTSSSVPQLGNKSGPLEKLDRKAISMLAAAWAQLGSVML